MTDFTPVPTDPATTDAETRELVYALLNVSGTTRVVDGITQLRTLGDHWVTGEQANAARERFGTTVGSLQAALRFVRNDSALTVATVAQARSDWTSAFAQTDGHPSQEQPAWEQVFLSER